MTASTQRTKLTPNDIAKAWGIARETVVSWIRSGELTAKVLYAVLFLLNAHVSILVCY